MKENGYIFSFGGFKQSEQLTELLKKLDIKKTTFHGLRGTHASFLFAQAKLLSRINARKKAPARCRCFKSVKCFIRLTLICTNLHQKIFANVGISIILLTF
ncbi:hypothetical protein [Salinibacillus kushneri]|uniref:hypothetical protein n=1 Tax=Salinibacillus kushneri TaxID=237682 RepID=UPI001FDEB1C4|nr:hypothetical protein [Salinibacillus kushneri]